MKVAIQQLEYKFKILRYNVLSANEGNQLYIVSLENSTLFVALF